MSLFLDCFVFNQGFSQKDSTMLKGFFHNIAQKHTLVIKDCLIYCEYNAKNKGYKYKNIGFFDRMVYYKKNVFITESIKTLLENSGKPYVADDLYKYSIHDFFSFESEWTF